MTLYSEIYNCYYQIVYALLKREGALTKKDIQDVINTYGFCESELFLLPKLIEQAWNLFEKDGDLFYKKIETAPALPLSTLQKSWIKALLLDKRIALFLSKENRELLETKLSEVEPLFYPNDFYYYDAFTDGDDFTDPTYQENFRKILSAIEKKQVLKIHFSSHKNNRVHHFFLPCKLEYSIKNDCFRLYALETRNRAHYQLFTINLSRIESIEEINESWDKEVKLDSYITKFYYKEPVTLLIYNQRNALERAMLQFANYRKNTTKIDENTYQCEIYYNNSNETELLIEILSFGPLVKVIGNEHFLTLLKRRLKEQKKRWG
ncbi:MAG: WYL domain-containing protein [Lachnospiraceae bacterium]|nr:WYL domain-containing protein [Lachnospiraceae bacterium]MEE1341826.1 WYL domain-containing protein [Lachnospiraceae bacterium]